MTPGLRQRMVRGAQAQVVGHVVRVIVQVGGVAILAGIWGLNLYGEWLILTAIPTYLTFSDTGLFAAASNEMIMLVARDERKQALEVFRSVSTAVSMGFVAISVALVAFAIAAPLDAWFHLSTIDEVDASAILVILGLNTLVMCYAGVLFGGFASEGRYGEGGMAIAGVTLAEFCGLAGVVIAGGGPVLGAAAMFVARGFATVTVYFLMRRRVPWLSIGKPETLLTTLKPLISPAFGAAAFPLALALNVQGMVIMLGVVVGPASTAIFSTVRTASRVVIQLLASVFSVISPELSRAYAQNNAALLRTLHRRGCQAAIWLAAPVLAVLAVFGGPIIDVWTSGHVQVQGALLYLFLIVAGLDSLWYTSLAVIWARNMHQRVALYYVLASVAVLPIAYGLLKLWGLDGAALALVLLEVFMMVVVLREALPAAHDTLRGWLGSIVRPPSLRRDGFWRSAGTGLARDEPGV